MANPGAPASTLMLENECPEAFDHIVQYMNTGSIRIPALSSVDAPLEATDITSAQAYKKPRKPEHRMECVGNFFLADKIDGSNLYAGLEPSYTINDTRWSSEGIMI